MKLFEATPKVRRLEKKCILCTVIESRWHSPYILVYKEGPLTNLPFGIGKPSILNLQVYKYTYIMIKYIQISHPGVDRIYIVQT